MINIERETALGGRLHNEGVLILAGDPGSRYAQEIPLTFSTSITFEQSYEEVEGNSASSAELSAPFEPLRLAHSTGFGCHRLGYQHGQVQVTGGVNEKIEGFFEVCRLKGVTGKQGVLIPQSNVKNLRLREDVVEVISQGEFHVYPSATIDEGIELLTGVEAGERDDEGHYPENTVNHAVQERLRDLAEKVQSFSKDSNDPEPVGEKEVSL